MGGSTIRPGGRKRKLSKRGRKKYYYRNNKRQGIGIKRKGRIINKTECLFSMNTILCNAMPTGTNSGKDMMDADNITIAIVSCCSYSIAKGKRIS